MHRRSFLSLSAVPVLANAAEADPQADWHETVSTDALTFKAVSDDERITLQVELIRAAEDEVTEVKDEKGEHIAYQYKGKKQPYPFHPGSPILRTLLTRFDLTWDGKAVEIPERFWNDLPALCIETSTLKLETVKPDLHWQAEEFLAKLRQPRVSLSAEGGTVLIEWERPEECDSHSTIRWIVSKSGVVLRHRHCPPHEC